MKILLKIAAALVAFLGVVTVLSVWGDKIVAWCRKVVIVTCTKAEPEEAFEEENETDVEEAKAFAAEALEEPVAAEADFEE